ncbi:MAG: hypothetical protein ACRD68_01565 [Pyrinomonadaceae bacterium]
MSAFQLAVLQVSVAPESREVMVGAAMPVHVTLTNGGEAALQVPDTLAFSEFEFHLRPSGGRGEARKLSARFAQFERNPDPLPPPPKMTRPLPPGEKIEYVENLANYATRPLDAGQYLLSVVFDGAYGRLESAPTPVAVVAPRVSALATAVGDQTILGTVFAHLTASGEPVIYQRESVIGRPDDGVAYQRFGSPALKAVAAAVKLSERPITRWFGWLQGDAIAGGAGEEHALVAHIEPVPLGLKSSTLQSVGWQPSVESATFAAVGADAQNRVALALVTFQVEGTGSVKTVRLAMPTIPVRWAARYHPQDAGGRYDVVTASNYGRAVLLQRHAVSSAAGTADPPVILTEREEPLAALALAPLAGTGAGAVDVLFGPAGGDKARMTFLRLSLDGGKPLARWTFSAPADAQKKTPTAWAIAPTPDPVVLAKLGDHLLVRRASSPPGWVPFMDGAAGAEHLRLEVLRDGSMWAIWADAAHGIRYKQVELR